MPLCRRGTTRRSVVISLVVLGLFVALNVARVRAWGWPNNPAARPMTGVLMGALWFGNAHLTHLSDHQFPDESAPWIVTKDGVWYLFMRQNIEPRPTYCRAENGKDHARTIVRVSYDRGATWSNAIVAAEPDPANPLMQCSVLDGTTFFDAETSTWHMLTQSQGGGDGWHLAHFVRQAADPAGRFDLAGIVVEPSLNNPITGVCGEGKACPADTTHAGTPDFLYKREGWYYLSFHTINNTPPWYFWRFVAKTQDFVTWYHADPGHEGDTTHGYLPDDAIFGPADCQTWQPGCVGGGAASIHAEGNWHYMLIETPTQCWPGVNNGFALVRSQNLPHSGAPWAGPNGNIGWQHYADPVSGRLGWLGPMAPNEGPPENRPGYARLFADGDDMYVTYANKDGVHFYQVQFNGAPPVLPAVRLQSYNGYYVSVPDGGDAGDTKVDGVDAAGWQRFALYDLDASSDGQVRSGHRVQFQVSDGHFLSTRQWGWVHSLDTRPSTSTTFMIVKMDAGDDVIRQGDRVALRASELGKYCAPDVPGGGPYSILTCLRTVPTWADTFRLTWDVLPPPPSTPPPTVQPPPTDPPPPVDPPPPPPVDPPPPPPVDPPPPPPVDPPPAAPRPVGPSVRLPGLLTASAAAGGYPVENANDGNAATQWVASLSADLANNQAWVQLDLRHVRYIDRVKWQGGAWSPYPAQSPADFVIEVSSDGATWSTAVSENNAGGVITGDRVINRQARFLRLRTTKVNDGTGWSLSFFEFWAEGPAEAASATDFDGDGSSDLIWRNTATGVNTIWTMNGASHAASTDIQIVPWLEWEIAAVADFNGDRYPDLIWRNTVTGQTTLWHMNGSTLLDWTTIEPTVTDPNWRIVGAGDLNGDGKADVVWRHAVTGATTVWFMDDAALLSWTALDLTADVHWKIIAVADFNGDGRSDLLWWQDATGWLAYWYMNGATCIGQVWVSTVSNVNWQPASVGDFNHDGYPDIVWRNYGDGSNVVWYMNDATTIGMDSLETVPDLNWTIIRRR